MFKIRFGKFWTIFVRKIFPPKLTKYLEKIRYLNFFPDLWFFRQFPWIQIFPPARFWKAQPFSNISTFHFSHFKPKNALVFITNLALLRKPRPCSTISCASFRVWFYTVQTYFELFHEKYKWLINWTTKFPAILLLHRGGSLYKNPAIRRNSIREGFWAPAVRRHQICAGFGIRAVKDALQRPTTSGRSPSHSPGSTEEVIQPQDNTNVQSALRESALC